jgi:hypothetical protein
MRNGTYHTNMVYISYLYSTSVAVGVMWPQEPESMPSHEIHGVALGLSATI